MPHDDNEKTNLRAVRELVHGGIKKLFDVIACTKKRGITDSSFWKVMVGYL